MARRDFEILLHALNRNGFEADARWRDASWQPRVDVYHNDDTIFVQVEAPGLDEKNLRLSYDAPSAQLTIEGVRSRPSCGAPSRCLQMEIEYGPFRRSLALPAEIDAAGIAAHLEAGFLLITVPRRKPQPPSTTRISID
ncbi:MAG TPA: Hsp20/alpha crystallin family protein [Abditibacteriaceae bacterium]